MASAPRTRYKKRLVVLCDGTWQDSTADNESAYPSNVTRFGRALSKYALDDSENQVEQIVYYQKGVGTGLMDRLFGGVLGLGLSANVRAAYSFLAHNYDEGDDIYFFGFSRGAYTARAVAGLVAETGLLTKRGMDDFPELYKSYYTFRTQRNGEEIPAKRFAERLGRDRLDPTAADAIQIVGVWDTVAFHKPLQATIPILNSVLKFFGFRLDQDRIEFHNTAIPARIKYGFHALALDERRKAYRPTMWRLPEPRPGQEPPQLLQVWFSGVHTDIGGGRRDHRLSDLALAWMVSECRKTGLLAFDESYLMRPGADRVAQRVGPWPTVHGPTKSDDNGIKAWLKRALETLAGKADRQPLEEPRSNEHLHCSIENRCLGSQAADRAAAKYPCGVLSGQRVSGAWTLKKGATHGDRLGKVEPGPVELELRGNIRPACDESTSST